MPLGVHFHRHTLSFRLSPSRRIHFNLRPAPSFLDSQTDLASLLLRSVDLTPELWLVKLLMGGIDSDYDSRDVGAVLTSRSSPWLTLRLAS